MKTVSLLICILISISSFGQGIWEALIIPDTLYSRNLNAEKEGILLIIAGSNNEHGGMLRSYNNGNEWTLLDLPIPEYIPIHSMKYSSLGTLFLGTSFCILSSPDNGDSFDPYFQTYGSITSIQESPEGELFAVGWGNIFRSSDDGISWDTLIFTNENKYYSDVDFGLNGEIYVVGGSFDGPGTGSGFHRSFDNGLTWENIGITEAHLDEIEVNSDGSIIVGGDQNYMKISYDGGENWESFLDKNTKALTTDNQDNIFNSVSGYNYIDLLFSEDWGNSWVSLLEDNFEPYVNKISISPDNTVYIQTFGQSNTVYRSINPILNAEIIHHEIPIKIYPNPVSKKISISNTYNNRLNKYKVYSLSGHNIKNGNINNNQIDFSNIKKGIYIVEIETGEHIVRKKILKK